MPPITAVLHTHNDALRLGRALETLCPCDEILIIDYQSDDGTQRVAKEYGAKIISAPKERAETKFSQAVENGWILCVDPQEALTESLSASLFEWKSAPAPPATSCFAVFQREETPEGWIQHPLPQTRLVPARWNCWNGRFPIVDSPVVSLEGQLLRFTFP